MLASRFSTWKLAPINTSQNYIQKAQKTVIGAQHKTKLPTQQDTLQSNEQLINTE